MPRSSILGFALIATCLPPFMWACSKDKGSSDAPAAGAAAAPATSSANADQDLADISKYRLTMDKIDKYIAAQRNIAMKAKNMSPAEREAMATRNSSDPDASIDDMTRRIESEPVFVSAIRDAGLSPREFTMLTMSMMQTGMAAGVAKMRPNDNQDSLIREMKANPDNVRFYNEHEAEITQKSKALQDEMKKLGVDDQ